MNTHSHTVAVIFFLGIILCALYWFSGGDKDIQSLIPHRSQIVIEKGIRKDVKNSTIIFCDRTFNITRVYIDGISVLDRASELLKEAENLPRCKEFNEKFPDLEHIGIDSVEHGESLQFYSLILGVSATSSVDYATTSADYSTSSVDYMTTSVDFPIYVETNQNKIALTASHILGSFDKTKPLNIPPPTIMVSSSPHDREIPYRPNEKNYNKIILVCDKKYMLWQGLMYKKENLLENVFAVIQNSPKNKKWFCEALPHDPRNAEVLPELNVFLEVLAHNVENENTQYVMRVSSWARGVGGYNPEHSADIHINIEQNILSIYQSPIILGRARSILEERFIYLFFGVIMFMCAGIWRQKKG